MKTIQLEEVSVVIQATIEDVHDCDRLEKFYNSVDGEPAGWANDTDFWITLSEINDKIGIAGMRKSFVNTILTAKNDGYEYVIVRNHL